MTHAIPLSNTPLVEGLRWLVVSEVCAGGYGAGRAKVRSTRSEERFVGRSASGAVVGVEVTEIVLAGRLISWRWRAWVQPALISVGYGFLGLKYTFRQT